MHRCWSLLLRWLHCSSHTDSSTDTAAVRSPADRAYCRTLLCYGTAESGMSFLPQDNPSDLSQKPFFVRTCANSALNAEAVICVSVCLLYHVWLHFTSSVRCCLWSRQPRPSENHCAILPHISGNFLTFAALTFHKRHDNLTSITNDAPAIGIVFDKNHNKIDGYVETRNNAYN